FPKNEPNTKLIVQTKEEGDDSNNENKNLSEKSCQEETRKKNQENLNSHQNKKKLYSSSLPFTQDLLDQTVYQIQEKSAFSANNSAYPKFGSKQCRYYVGPENQVHTVKLNNHLQNQYVSNNVLIGNNLQSLCQEGYNPPPQTLQSMKQNARPLNYFAAESNVIPNQKIPQPHHNPLPKPNCSIITSVSKGDTFVDTTASTPTPKKFPSLHWKNDAKIKGGPTSEIFIYSWITTEPNLSRFEMASHSAKLRKEERTVLGNIYTKKGILNNLSHEMAKLGLNRTPDQINKRINSIKKQWNQTYEWLLREGPKYFISQGSDRAEIFLRDKLEEDCCNFFKLQTVMLKLRGEKVPGDRNHLLTPITSLKNDYNFALERNKENEISKDASKQQENDCESEDDLSEDADTKFVNNGDKFAFNKTEEDEGLSNSEKRMSSSCGVSRKRKLLEENLYFLTDSENEEDSLALRNFKKFKFEKEKVLLTLKEQKLEDEINYSKEIFKLKKIKVKYEIQKTLKDLGFSEEKIMEQLKDLK
ncbi:hypothetical protein HK099_001951, partial [Clydaea vesicula]